MLLALTGFRLWYASTHELLQDETYYWQWSRHLAWGYYDNTPFAALLIRFFTSLLDATPLGVRAGAIICALIASVLIYLLGKRLFGNRIALVALVLANIIPLFAAGSIIMTMDPPQLALWAAALYVIHCAVTSTPNPSLKGSESGNPRAGTSTPHPEGRNLEAASANPRMGRLRSAGLWLLAGVLAGLAALSKIYALLLLPSILVFLCVSPGDRHWLRRPEPYVAAMIALAVFAPFVWWTHTHQDAFWRHVGVMGSRGGEQSAPLEYFWRDVGDQALMLSPFLYLVYMYALWDTFKRGLRWVGSIPHPNPLLGKEREPDVTTPFQGERGNSNLLFAWAPAATVTVAIALLSLHTKVEANWAAAAYVSGVYLIAFVLTRLWDSRTVARRAWVVICCLIASLMGVVAYFPQPIYELIALGNKDQSKALQGLIKSDRTNELYGWDMLASRIDVERRAMGGNPFIFGINYRMPSEAAFVLPDHPQTYSLFLGDRANEYMFWEDPSRLVGRNAIFINDTDGPDHLDDVRAVFDRVDVEPPLLVYRNPPYGPYPIRTIQVWRCYGFHGYDVRRWQKGW